MLGVLPGVLGTLQATEAIKLITGVGEPLIGRLLTYDALEMRFEEFRVAPPPRLRGMRRRAEPSPSRAIRRRRPPCRGLRRLSAGALQQLLRAAHGARTAAGRCARGPRVRRRTSAGIGHIPLGRAAAAPGGDRASSRRRCSSAAAADAACRRASWRCAPACPRRRISRADCRLGARDRSGAARAVRPRPRGAPSRFRRWGCIAIWRTPAVAPIGRLMRARSRSKARAARRRTRTAADPRQLSCRGAPVPRS